MCVWGGTGPTCVGEEQQPGLSCWDGTVAPPTLAKAMGVSPQPCFPSLARTPMGTQMHSDSTGFVTQLSVTATYTPDRVTEQEKRTVLIQF